MENKSTSRVVLDLSDEKPMCTLFYKGEQLIKTPIIIPFKTILRSKPKRQDETYQKRLKNWQKKINKKMLSQIIKNLDVAIFGKEFNEETDIEIIF